MTLEGRKREAPRFCAIVGGLEAQGQLTELLDELYGVPDLLADLYVRRSLAFPLHEPGDERSVAVLYEEAASVFR